jgi:AraC-like DNA-binding protein
VERDERFVLCETLRVEDAEDHDRNATTPDRDTVTMMAGIGGVIGAALERLRLEGAIFLRGEYSEAWAYESPTGEMMAQLLRPGRERLLFFHIIASGRCWLTIDDGERHWAEAGDVVVIPYGHQHKMGGVTDATCVSVLDLMSPPPWTELPVVRHGAGGGRTDVICGYLDVEDPLFDPALAALPPIFVVRPTGAAKPWVESSLRYVLEATEGGATDSEILTRLPAIVLSEVLRLHVESAPAADRGWLAALRDPVLAPALAELHRAPERKWTVGDLAAAAHVSKTVLDERFRAMLGRSPIRYLTDWRMHVAKELLATTDLSVHAVARRVGYDAEEAFSRAFKRAHGQAPAHWRAAASS